MMKTYILMKQDRTFVHIGNSAYIVGLLGVTRQAISKACKNGSTIGGYLIESHPYEKYNKRTKKWYLGKSLELLRNARHIIDDYNNELIARGEYANVNIIMRIDNILREAVK